MGEVVGMEGTRRFNYVRRSVGKSGWSGSGRGGRG